MIDVYEIKQVPENCTTCLFGNTNSFFFSCSCADRQHDYLYYKIHGNCPSYWLDQHKYVRYT